MDMTDEIFFAWRGWRTRTSAKAGAREREFLRGEIEHNRCRTNSVRGIISNCVINLSADKERYLREEFRALKRGGTAGRFGRE